MNAPRLRRDLVSQEESPECSSVDPQTLTEEQKQRLEELQLFKNKETSVDIEVRVSSVFQMLLLIENRAPVHCGRPSQAANRLNLSGAGGFEGEAHSSAPSGEDAVSRPGD